MTNKVLKFGVRNLGLASTEFSLVYGCNTEVIVHQVVTKGTKLWKQAITLQLTGMGRAGCGKELSVLVSGA